MKKENRIPITYRIINKITFIKKLIRLGGIKFKWALVIFFIILIMVGLFGLTLTFLSSNALLEANDKLCQTIAGSISATESILTAEKKPSRRSLILQDVITSLTKGTITGLKYAAVYDLKGELAERKKTYAAHTDSSKKNKWIPLKIFSEIEGISSFEKKRVVLNEKNRNVPCYQYRMPFTFFDIPVGVIEIVFTEESILAPIWQIVYYIIALGVLFLVLGVVISTKVSGGMVRPIRKLTGGMSRVRDGDLNAEINIYRHDELGDLSIEFNNMISHLREKIYMQKFVSNSTISMIKEQTKTKTNESLELGGSRENLAFLFSDVRGFTAMSEKIEPEEVVSILNEYLDLQSQIIQKNHGDIDKFVGDEIMAVFTGEDRADNALKSAIEIIRQIKHLNEERAAKKLRILDVGIGINIGDVVHGRMGSRERMDMTSIGDAVNLAARLCSKAEANQILSSEAVITQAARGKFKGRKLDPITVKGKEKPIKIFEIHSMKK